MKIYPSILTAEREFREFWSAAIQYQKSKQLPLWPSYPEEKIRGEITPELHFSAFMLDGDS
jgi:hypothetical protein